MAKALQLFPYPLKALTFSAGGRDQIDLSMLPAKVGDRFAHLARIDIIGNVTPTLSSGTAGADAIQAVVKNITLKNQIRTLFDDSCKALRLFEALERGVLAPEPDAAASGDAVNFKRSFFCGPPLMDGSPSDFLEPCGVFKGATLDVVYGALADITNCTAMTATFTVTAQLAFLDEVRVPPFLERRGVAITPDVGFGGEALHLFLGLCKSNAYPVIAAGDFGNVQVLGTKAETQQFAAADLERMYHEDMDVGALTQVHGEIKAATDDNPKMVSGTAVAAATSVMSPIVWSPNGGRLTKCWAKADTGARLKWSGTQTTGYGLNTRVLPRSSGDTAKYMAAIEASIGMKLGSGDIKTLSKQGYSGPLAPFMPLVFKPK